MDNKSGSGIGCCTVLAIIFIVLKLTHLIKWSWFWVLSPIWIPITIFVIIAAIIMLYTVKKKKDR